MDLAAIAALTDYFTSLPNKLIDATLGAQQNLLERKDRIRLLKELVTLREVGKILQRLYLFKGDFLAYVDKVAAGRSIAEVKWIKECMDDVCITLLELKQFLSKSDISNVSLVVETRKKIPVLVDTYKQLIALPDDIFLEKVHFTKIARMMEAMELAGQDMIKRLDDERRALENMRGE